MRKIDMVCDTLHVNACELNLIASIMWKLQSNEHSDAIRKSIINEISQLLHAEFVASFVWNKTKKISTRGLSLNINPVLMRAYEEKMHAVDLVTPVMRKYRHATIVDDVFSRQALEMSEHYNEFLLPCGMHHGINVYFLSDREDVGDLRIWRGNSEPPFSRRDVLLLDALTPHFESALTCHAPKRSTLTTRETDVVNYIKKGFSDKKIAKELNISFTTVRSHLNNAMKKMNCSNRTELAITFGEN